MSRVRSASAGATALSLVVAVFAGASGSSPSPGFSPGGLPVFAPDTPLVLTARLTGAGGGIFVKNTDGTGPQQLATDVLPGVHKHASWSPDGQHVVFIDESTERMWIAHLDGSSTEAVAACDTPGCDYPAWSPDGTRIAYSRYESEEGVVGPAAVGLYVVDLVSGVESAVIRLERPLLADAPRWSPDGKQLVFGVDRMDDEAWETGAAIAVVPVTGGEPRYLTPFEDFGYGPDWGWATDEIVYGISIREWMKGFDASGETWNIFGIQPDGSGLRQISQAEPGERFRGPRWTPDGSGITAYRDQTPGGVLVDPLTGSFEPFATTGDELRPQVRPTP